MIRRLPSWRGLVFIAGAGLICAIVVSLVIASRPSRPKGYGKDLPPARLLEDFHSYSTVETVRSNVRARGLQWNVIKEPMSPPSKSKPFYIAKVPNFSHLGVSGDLSFFFFRDRLFRIEFAPPDPLVYWNALLRAEKLQEVRLPNEHLRARLGDDVVVWLNIGVYSDAPFVGWRDQRLEDEVSYRFD